MVTNEPVTSTTSEGSGTGAASIYRSNTHTLVADLTQDDNYVQCADPSHILACIHNQKLVCSHYAKGRTPYACSAPNIETV